MEYKNAKIRVAMQELDSFLKDAKAYEADLRALSSNFRGDELARRRNERVQRLTNAMRDAQDACRESVEALTERLETAEKKALDQSMLTDDFRFLQLPVKLTEKQLSALADRNKGNPLFMQAVEQYANERNYDDFILPSGALETKRRSLSDYRALLSDLFSKRAEENPAEVADDLQWAMVAGIDRLEQIDSDFAD